MAKPDVQSLTVTFTNEAYIIWNGDFRDAIPQSIHGEKFNIWLSAIHQSAKAKGWETVRAASYRVSDEETGKIVERCAVTFNRMTEHPRSKRRYWPNLVTHLNQLMVNTIGPSGQRIHMMGMPIVDYIPHSKLAERDPGLVIA